MAAVQRVQRGYGVRATGHVEADGLDRIAVLARTGAGDGVDLSLGGVGCRFAIRDEDHLVHRGAAQRNSGNRIAARCARCQVIDHCIEAVGIACVAARIGADV